jgi:hypothetical protein
LRSKNGKNGRTVAFYLLRTPGGQETEKLRNRTTKKHEKQKKENKKKNERSPKTSGDCYGGFLRSKVGRNSWAYA